MPTIKRLLAPAALLLSFTAVVAAIAEISNPFFESDFITALKKKFSSFNEKARQDRLYLQTDKTLYSPGETVWFSAFLRDEQTLKPSVNSDVLHVEFITPKGTTARHYKLVASNGIAKGDIDLSGMVGGIYKLRAYTDYQKNDTSALVFEKEITVQSVVMPRLKMKLEFEKKAYGKGDEVVANLELHTNANTPLVKTKVKFSAMLEGKELNASSVTTDAAGKTQIKFNLPQSLNTTDGVVNAMIDFEGTTESISRSVPIVLNKIDLAFYPEGGDMVNGVNQRIAFRAINEFNKPADIEGIIVNSKGEYVSEFKSYHFGMGSFNLLPKAGETYKARLTKPAGILDEFELPEALKAGYVLQVNGAGNELHLSVNSWQPETLSIAAQVRGKLYFSGSFKAQKGNNLLTVHTEDFPIGVTQITLFDSKGIARCERLAFVNREKQLNISVSTNKQTYQPREKVTMNIRVTDENGLPMPGNFGLSVVDDNQLSFADDKQGNILSKMLLEPELKEKVEEANFYFDTKEEKSAQALDNLLLTSGWRHYTWKEIDNEDFPLLKFVGEKALLNGRIIDGYTSQPVSNATVKLLGSNKQIVTGKDGFFQFSKFDLAVNNQLDITAKDFNGGVQVIANYGSGIDYYIYNNRYRYEFDAIPAAAGGVMDMDEIEVVANKRMEQKAPARNEKKKDALKENREELNFADVMEVPAPDVAEEPVQQADGDDNANGLAENGKMLDQRLVAFQKADKNIEAAQQVIYYRAKEFAQKKYTATDSSRNDLASTVYWNGNVETDRYGKAKVEFVTNDLISSFKTTLEGFGDDGSIGRTEYSFTTNLPFSMDTKIPVEAVSGDKMMIPVFLKNTTAEDISGELSMKIPQQLTTDSRTLQVIIPAKNSKVIYLNCVASTVIGGGAIELQFHSSNYNDALTRNIKIVPKGFPADISLSAQESDKHFTIKPVNVVPGSMRVTFTAYPNVMSDLMSGVDAILREPYGCFEQTSSSNYPNIMAMQYLQNTKTADPKVEARAKQLLEDGYKKLVSFETKENGYEWFGAAPAHEALTAYGLMEFVDMKKVYSKVDEAMIERTAQLLLNKRDGNGGFKKNPRALDSFGAADEDITNCYIVYAMSEAGKGNLIDKEINTAYRDAKKSNDPYMLALMANALFNVGDTKRGDELVSLLVNAKQEAAFWNGKKHSITRSTGDALKIETTSLVALAVMKSPNPDVQTLQTAVKFLVGQRSGYGMFGSTQSTILALKALSKFAEFSKKTDESGTIEVLVNGSVVATKNYAKGERNNVEITGLENFIAAGTQDVQVRFKGCKNPLPYTMHVNYSTALPNSDKACAVSLATQLSAKQVKVGETLRLTATLKNKTNEGQPMTMAIIGLPAGLTAQPWQLKEMQEKGVFDFYEVIGNNIACYYRDLAPGEQKVLNFDLKAELPGEYDAPASSAYLYYTNELKTWVGLDRVFVNP
ncbi:MAG: MG2 domain-containing protein [Chitinophagales bacterium]